MIKTFLPLVLGFFVCSIFSFIYLQRISAFGCFDDCNNFMGGYFLLKGKHIYTDFFFNHQMLMAYISAGTQLVFNPESLYKLVLYHRIVILIFSFVFSLLLIWRFRYVSLGFVLLYESTKFYVFGDRFLAESFIVYPFVYLIGLLWLIYKKKKIFPVEYLACGLFIWFIVFIREPYIPVAVIIFLLLFFTCKKNTLRLGMMGIFLGLTLVTLLSISIPDMVNNIYTINKGLITYERQLDGTSGFGIFRIFLYPGIILFQGNINILRICMIVIDLFFLFSFFFFVKEKNGWKAGLFILFLLGILNIRITEPGTMYYRAYHMMVWYACFIFITLLLISNLKNKLFQKICIGIFICLFFFTFIAPDSFIRNRPNKAEEFTTNYGQYYSMGDVIKTLSKKDATVFLELRDDLIYWQAERQFAYKYLNYTGIMPAYKPYRDAREEMFAKYPPDFYYGDCPPKSSMPASLLKEYRNLYQQIYFAKQPTCLFVKKALIPGISKDQWHTIKEKGYTL